MRTIIVSTTGRPVTIPVAGRIEVADYARLIEHARANRISLAQFVSQAVLAALPSETGTNEE